MDYFRSHLAILLSLIVASTAYADKLSGELERDLKEVLHRKFQIAYRKKLARKFPLALVEITEDCKAATLCKSGVRLACTVQGQHTSCYSDTSGTICLLEDSNGRIAGSTGSC